LPSFVEKYLPSTPMVEYFSTRRSFYHDLHTLSKLSFSMSMVFLTVYLKDPRLILFMPLIALSLVAASRLPVVTVLRWSLTPALFAAVLCVFLPLIGYPLTGAILIFVKAVTSAWFMFLLILTTPITNLARVISRVLPPWLADTLILTSRYFFLFFDEVQRMFRAMDSRGSPPLKRKLLLTSNMMATLFVRGYERAERVYVAMSSRGYKSRIPLASSERFRMRDTAFIASNLAILAAFSLLEVIL